MSRVLPILEYHGIAQPPKAARKRLLYVRPAQFRGQMTLLRLLGFRAVTVSRGLELLRAGSSERVVALSFDDAYDDVFRHALPVLLEYGFAATCYAVSGRLGQYNTWDADVLNVRKPIMTAEQLERWQLAGMEVGGHTRTHPRLTACSEQQLEDEVLGGKHELEATLGTAVRQFCYPWGDHDPRVRASVARAGYQAAVTTMRGRARSSDDVFALPRVPVHGHRSLAAFPFRTLTGYADKRRRD